MIARLSIEATLWASALILVFLILFFTEETFRAVVLFLLLLAVMLACVAAPVWLLSGWVS